MAASDRAPATTRSLIPARIGSVWFAVDALDVQEILGARPWVPIPHASPHIAGVLPWRGRAIAILDISTLAGGEALRPGVARPRTLVLEASSCTLAVPVDGVRETQDVPETLLRSPHVTTMAYCTAEADMFGSSVPVLDIAAVVEAVLASAPGRT